MLVLHQWCNITAYGEEAIIKEANEYQLWQFISALARVANGYKPFTTIEEATEYFNSGCGPGVVNDEIQPNEIPCEE